MLIVLPASCFIDSLLTFRIALINEGMNRSGAKNDTSISQFSMQSLNISENNFAFVNVFCNNFCAVVLVDS